MRLPEQGRESSRPGRGRDCGGLSKVGSDLPICRAAHLEVEMPTRAQKWPVADSDMHVMEPADLWQRYIDPEWAHAAPVGLSEIQRDMRVRVKNAVMLRMGRTRPRLSESPWSEAQDSAFAHAEARNWDAKSQVAAMDMEGIDSTVLFPSRGLFVLALQSSSHIGPDGMDPGLSSAIARAYNDWMADFVTDCEAPGPCLRCRHARPPRRRRCL